LTQRALEVQAKAINTAPLQEEPVMRSKFMVIAIVVMAGIAFAPDLVRQLLN